jgi:tryptophan synthase alpha chain
MSSPQLTDRPETASGSTDLMPSRIAAAFAKSAEENRAAVMPFWTAGYPTIEQTDAMLDAIVAGGADLIELGVPFSDPLADGTTVQLASQVALSNGASLAESIAIVKRARERGITIPIVLMGYTNPFLQYGLERLAAEAVEAGIDGFIVPDLPLEESEEFNRPLKAHGRDLIFLVAPTSTEARISDAASRASGFIYCVSLTGVTGARDTLSADLGEYMARVRKATNLPLALGFGISRPEHVREATAFVDGVIVASALMNYVDSLPPDQQASGAESFIREFVAAARRPVGA